MSRTVINTPQGPAAIGPYSQAIRAGNLIFVSGQIAIDPATGHIIQESGIQGQTRQCLQNLLAIVSAAGGSARHVVKTTVFLKDMNEFAEMNAVYSEFFTTDKPARSTVAVAGLPRDVRVEIDCIAVLE